DEQPVERARHPRVATGQGDAFRPRVGRRIGRGGELGAERLLGGLVDDGADEESAVLRYAGAGADQQVAADGPVADAPAGVDEPDPDVGLAGGLRDGDRDGAEGVAAVLMPDRAPRGTVVDAELHLGRVVLPGRVVGGVEPDLRRGLSDQVYPW